MTFLTIVVCQIGSALAARTERASLRSIGFFTNPLLLWGILFEVVFAAAVAAAPPLQAVFGTAVPPAEALLLLVPCPLIVWGADEVRRAVMRRRERAWSGERSLHEFVESVAVELDHEASALMGDLERGAEDAAAVGREEVR